MASAHRVTCCCSPKAHHTARDTRSAGIPTGAFEQLRTRNITASKPPAKPLFAACGRRSPGSADQPRLALRRIIVTRAQRARILTVSGRPDSDTRYRRLRERGVGHFHASRLPRQRGLDAVSGRSACISMHRRFTVERAHLPRGACLRPFGGRNGPVWGCSGPPSSGSYMPSPNARQPIGAAF
jgi:hypothetical protein